MEQTVLVFCCFIVWISQVSAADNCTDITVDIVDSQPEPGIYCELPVFFRTNIFWSITKPASGGKETRIAQCGRCAAYGPACQCGVFDSDYNVTRTSIDQSFSNSTLYFINNVHNINGSIIKCSAADNTACVTIQLNVIQAYSLSSCDNDTINVYENNKNTIPCKVLEDSHGMYWNITYPNGTVETVAECPPCDKKSNCTCDVNNGDFDAERIGTLSRLRLVRGIDRQKDGATLTCSRKDGFKSSQCQLKILYYTLPQCENGQLDISEAGKRLPITCDGVGPGHSVNWTLTDDSGYVTDLAICTGSDCTSYSDVTMSRTDSASTLTFAGNAGLKGNSTLTCVRSNGGTKASCQIRVPDEHPGPFPWFVVGVVVGAVVAVIIIIIVIVVVVVVTRRRASRKGSKQNKTKSSAEDDEFEEHINDLYQSADAETPTPSDRRQQYATQHELQQIPSSVQAVSHDKLQTYSNVTPTNPDSRELTKMATTDDVYNVLGDEPGENQKADQVYNHLTSL
ncbi:uncharacterized protein [Littorina saxatilis]|uniref:Ig-like domain-containing protein n=1 Tax=Littorina saxatilis TaxID=31220 RepID=A0AAN9BJZ1_9CAEN